MFSVCTLIYHLLNWSSFKFSFLGSKILDKCMLSHATLHVVWHIDTHGYTAHTLLGQFELEVTLIFDGDEISCVCKK